MFNWKLLTFLACASLIIGCVTLKGASQGDPLQKQEDQNEHYVPNPVPIHQ